MEEAPWEAAPVQCGHEEQRQGKTESSGKQAVCRSCRDAWRCSERGNGVGRCCKVPLTHSSDFKYAFSQEKKKKKKKSLVPPPPICNFLALIITKCGGICLCTCDGCQQHWKAVIGGKRRKKSLCFVEQSSVEHFR